MTRVEIAHLTTEVKKEGQEAVAITEEIEDKEATAIVETIGNVAMIEAEEEMIEETVETEEGVIAEIVTLEEIDQKTELEVNQEIVNLVLIKMIDDAVSLLRTEPVALQTAI